MPATDLPTEIVLEIASYLDFEDASPTHLALTCRQLYSTLLPQILDNEARYIRDIMIPLNRIVIHQGCDNPEHSQPKSHSVQTLFKGTFRKFEFEAVSDARDLRCVRRMVLCAPQLEHVVLRIPQSGCLLRRLVAYINICASRPNLALEIFGSRGNMYIGSAVLSSRSPPGQGTLPSKAKDMLNPVLTAANRLFRGWSPGPKDRRSRAPLSLILRPQLNSLTIENASLLLSPVSPIIKDLMNEAPITNLSISDPAPNLFATPWSRTLLSVSMPVLTHLSLTNLMSFPDLFGFLESHPLITHLTLDMVPTKDLPAVEVPKEFALHHLTFLAATPRYLVPFILHHKQRGGFPVLRHLSLRVPLQFTYVPLQPSRRGVHDHAGRDFHLVYDLIVDSYKSVTIDGLMNSGLIEWMISSPESAAGWPTPRQFSGVEELVVANDFMISDQTRVALLEWIDDHCPSLTKDIFIGAKNCIPTSIQENLLKKFIWYTSPQLRILQLGTNEAPGPAVARINRPRAADLLPKY